MSTKRKQLNIGIVTFPLLKSGITPLSNLVDILYPLSGDFYLITGPEEVNLKKLVNKLNLRANVEFLGFIENHDDVIRQLKASDVFALPSIVEGFGMVVIEAMAAGIPYVASDIPPIREVTSKGIGGLLFEPTNCEDLALKL